MTKQLMFKIILTGNGGVGKTSIKNVIIGRKFEAHYMMTIGADFGIKEHIQEDSSVRLQIWDVAGQERFTSIRSVYYLGARGVLLVYDVTRPETFDDLKNWYETVKEYIGTDINKISLIILGNKVDLATIRKVPLAKAQKFAKSINAMHFETSALLNKGLSEVENYMVSDLVDKTVGSVTDDDKLEEDLSVQKPGLSILKTTVKPFLIDPTHEVLYELK